MAIIVNRSPYAITARGKADLYREFPVFKRAEAEAYLQSLLMQGIKASLKQLEHSFQVLARDRGYPRFCLTFDTREEAEKTLKRIESERALSVFRDYAAATRTTVAALVERYIVDVCPKHKGGESEVYRLRRLLRCEPFLQKPLSQLGTEDLQDLITNRLTEVAPATVDRDLDVLRQVLRYAADVWKVSPSEDPFMGLRRPRYFNERDRRLRGDEEARLRAAARACGNQWYEPIIVLALETGMRRSELLSLTWDNIDVQARSAFLPVTKNGRSRRVPLSSIALQVLESLPRAGEMVFPATANGLKLAWARTICPAAGIEDLHFHDLRHEATSRFAESGLFTLVELQAITGHRDTRMSPIGMSVFPSLSD
jgi:integrase